MMVGKITSTSLFVSLLLATTLIALGVVSTLTGAMSVGPTTMVGIGATLAPVVLASSALTTLMAAGAKSVKEAQSAAAVLVMLPMASMMLAMHPPQRSLWVSVLPVVSQNQLISKLVRAETIASVDWAMSVIPTLVVAAGFCWLATRRYHDERFIISA